MAEGFDPRARMAATVAIAIVLALTTPSACRRGAPVPAQSEDASLAGLVPPDPKALFAGVEQESIEARIETDQGILRCQVNHRRTPRAAAMFVALAAGRWRWRDPATRAETDRPMYENIEFFRAIEHVMIQSGCPLNKGTGDPGYRIEVEADAGDAQRLSQPGALVLARYTPPANREDPHPPMAGQVLGSQFAILLTDMHHLAGQVSVIGQCSELDVAHAIATRLARDKVPSKLLRIRIDGAGSNSR